MKKLILLTLFVPFLGFAQNPKAEKVANDINTAATVIGNMVDLFKKSKNETPNKDNKKSANISSDGTFPANTKPEDIVAKLYKCTYKKLDEENYCVWKPTTAALKQKDYDVNNTKIMFAVAVDTVLAFKQNGIDNTVIVTSFNDYSTDDNNSFYCSDCDASRGVIRFQTTEGKMKPISYYKLDTEMRIREKPTILKLDEDNIFYSVPSSEYFSGGSRSSADIFSLNGEFLFSYCSGSSWGGVSGNQGYSEMEMKIDNVNKTFKLIDVTKDYNTKGKLTKSTKETVGTYKYGNGTIIEIPTPKPATTGKKKK